MKKLIKLYAKLKTPEDKNNLLKELLYKVEYTKEVNGRWHNKPDDFELVLYPKITD